MTYEPTNIESAVTKTLKVPPAIQADIVVSLEKKGIIEDERLEIILPALAASLQISKPDGSEEYKVTLMNAEHKEVLMKGDDKPWTIEDWISDYVFPETGDNDNSNTISYEDSLSPTPEQVKGIAEGTLKVLPKKREVVDKNAISSSELREQTRTGAVSVEDVASGKTKVDLSK